MYAQTISSEWQASQNIIGLVEAFQAESIDTASIIPVSTLYDINSRFFGNGGIYNSAKDVLDDFNPHIDGEGTSLENPFVIGKHYLDWKR